MVMYATIYMGLQSYLSSGQFIFKYYSLDNFLTFFVLEVYILIDDFPHNSQLVYKKLVPSASMSRFSLDHLHFIE